jgi:hypothetical protein
MRGFLASSARVVVLLLATAGLAIGQEAVVTREVNLRRDPSSSRPPIRQLRPRTVSSPSSRTKRNGYYHVRTEDHEEGWVWGANIRVLGQAHRLDILI